MSRANIGVCFAFFASIAFPQTDYFPLQVGNQWVYRSAGRGQPIVMEVLKSGDFDGTTYYLTRNFLNRDAWLRSREDGVLVAYDPGTKQESALAAFGEDEGSPYSTGIDPCNSAAKIISRSAKARLPLGQFDNALAIDYSPQKCADAGLVTEQYLPWIGLVQRSRETIAGPQIYDLYYARIGGTTVISAPEVTFGVTLDRAIYDTPQVMARLTLRVVQPDPLSLNFFSGQEFDLEVRNSAGGTVYRWSDGQAFAQVLHSLSVGPGEKNYAIQFQLDGLPPGVYTAEAWLTTEDPQRYRARVAFEIRK